MWRCHRRSFQQNVTPQCLSLLSPLSHSNTLVRTLAVKQDLQRRKTSHNCLLRDPIAEAIFNDLDPDGKLEFTECGQRLQRKKIGKAKSGLGPIAGAPLQEEQKFGEAEVEAEGNKDRRT